MTTLRYRPPADEGKNRSADRESRQFKALDAVLNRPTLSLVCLLARVTAPSPYENYQLPEAPAELAFAIKGALRCEMLEDPEGVEWRRLFGTSKQGWKTQDERLPKAWQSRALFYALERKEGVVQFLRKCPFRSWGTYGRCTLEGQLAAAEEGQFVLIQIHDVWLEPSKTQTFASLLEGFLREKSRLLTYVGRCDCLNFRGGGRE